MILYPPIQRIISTIAKIECQMVTEVNWLERVKSKHRKICPDCKLVNPVSAEECYCGYQFKIEVENESHSFLSKPSTMIFTILVLLMIGFILFSMVEGFILATCERLNLN